MSIKRQDPFMEGSSAVTELGRAARLRSQCLCAMWSDTPKSIPDQWRHDGARELANAIGFGQAQGNSPAMSSTKCAYVWYDAQDARHTISFGAARQSACKLACLIRAYAVVSGQLIEGVSDNTAFVSSLILRRTASLPLSQLASFKAGATFLPCDPTWPIERTIGILSEAKAGIALIDDCDGAEELAVSNAPSPFVRAH